MHSAAKSAYSVNAFAAIQSVALQHGQDGLDDTAGGRLHSWIVFLRGDHRGRVSSGMTLDEGAICSGETTDGIVARFTDRRAAQRRVEIAQCQQFEFAAQALEAADVVVERR